MKTRTLRIDFFVVAFVLLILILTFVFYRPFNHEVKGAFTLEKVINSTLWGIPPSEGKPLDFSDGTQSSIAGSGGGSGGSAGSDGSSAPEPSVSSDSGNSNGPQTVQSGSDHHEDSAPVNQEATCGNFFESGESCDDGNLEDGDGCSSSCLLEDNYICDNNVGQVSECILNDSGGVEGGSCGDGLLDDGETCDDGNLLSRDGCQVDCTIEEGYSCEGAPSVCTAVCGDGYLAREEECDDGNLLSRDGCSVDCFVQQGYECYGSPSVCTAVCGDGDIAGGETCDDGGIENGDGCSSSCSIEEGYSCTDLPSVCSTVCGDGIIAGKEDCDDGNDLDNDGCSSSCTIEEECPPLPPASPAILSDPCRFRQDLPRVIASLIIVLTVVFFLVRHNSNFKSKLKHLFV